VHEDDVARLIGAGLAAMPRVEISEATAPAAMAAEKERLFIIYDLSSFYAPRPRLIDLSWRVGAWSCSLL
jgi:hypothetical protein